MKKKINCPVCKNGFIEIDLNLFYAGTSFECSEPNCDATIKLPENFEGPAAAFLDELK